MIRKEGRKKKPDSGLTSLNTNLGGGGVDHQEKKGGGVPYRTEGE